MSQNICRFNQVGFCKYKSECGKIHKNEICKDRNCDTGRCTKRHPKSCRNYLKHQFCNFGKDCAYLHTDTVKKEHFNEVVEDMKNIKAELDHLKNTVKTLSEINKEGKLIKKSIDVLKADIVKIKAANLQISKKVKMIEADMESETDENFDSDETETNYEAKNIEVDDTIETAKIDYENEDGSECDLFQIEMVNGDMVWACNICEYGFDSSNEIQTHMKSSHNKVINIKEYGDMPGKETYTLDEGTLERKTESETIESDGMFTCRLCLERLDGNNESKKHYIKEHKQDFINTRNGNKCEFAFCMDIEVDECSQFCNFYKNMLDL